jgi:hypothetical protein
VIEPVPALVTLHMWRVEATGVPRALLRMGRDRTRIRHTPACASPSSSAPATAARSPSAMPTPTAGGLLATWTAQDFEYPSRSTSARLRHGRVWFGIIERQAIHRGTFRSVPELNKAIRTFIDGWNDRALPFTWTKTADQILSKANRKKTSASGH